MTVLYEKNYTSLSEVAAALADRGPDAIPEPRPIEDVYKDVAMAKKVPIPGRDERIAEFIDTAREASDEFMVSVKILLFEDRVQARYTLTDGLGTLKFLSGLIDLADSASFILPHHPGLVNTFFIFSRRAPLFSQHMNTRRIFAGPLAI